MEKILELQQDYFKFSTELENNINLAGKPNKSAIRRARKNLLDIKRLAGLMRIELMTYQKSL